MELQCGFDHSDEPSTGFEVSDVGLDRTDPGMGLALNVLVPKGRVAVSHFQATDFDGVSQLGSGSMGFDVTDGSRIDTGIEQCGADCQRLSNGVGRGETDATCSDAHSRPLDHGIDAVFICDRISKRL